VKQFRPGDEVFGASAGFMGMFLGPVVSRLGSKTLGFMGIMKPSHSDLVFIGELLEAGKVVPVIDRRYSPSAAAEAIRYLAEGHAREKIVLTVDDNRQSESPLDLGHPGGSP
jgi:hypothetical protein